MTAERLPRSIWVPVLLLALVIFGWRLNTVPLTNWDEGIYANVNLELFHSHDWTKLTYFGADFLEKPPLQFWLTFVLFGLLGPTELAVRLLPAIAGIGTALLLALWAWQATKQRGVAMLAGIMFTLGQFALVHAFRTGDLDGLLALFITVSVYGYWRSWQSPRWIVVWGAAGAAAVMTKSFVGVLPLAIVGLDIIVSRGWRRIGWGNIGWAVTAFVVLAMPWHIIETLRFGSAFWDSYFGLHVLERTAESLFTATPWYWYVGIMIDRFAPFSWLLPLAVFTALWRWRQDSSGLDRLLIVWLVVTMLLFSLIQTRREWYILPIYPAAVMMVAIAAWSWWRDRQSSVIRGAMILSATAAFGYLMTDHHLRLALAHFPVLKELTRPWWRTLSGQVAFGVIAILILVVAALLLARWRSSWWRWFVGLGGGAMVCVALGWSLLYIYSLPATLPLKTIANYIKRENVNNLSLIGTALKKQPAGYFYILRLDTHSTEYASGTPPPTPLVLTTVEDKNSPLNTRGRVVARKDPFILLDLR